MRVIASTLFLLCGIAGIGVGADRVTIRALYYASSESQPKSLTLRGSGTPEFANWTNAISMMQNPEGTWSASVSFPQNASIEFKVLYEGKIWQLGSNVRALPVDGTTITVCPWFFETSGTYFIGYKSVPSKFFQNTRDVVLYFPPSYLENIHPNASFQTLVVSDGENFFNDSTSFAGRSWRAQPTLDELIVSGQMEEPLVVVAPYNTEERMAEYTPINGTSPDTAPYCQGAHSCGYADQYLDWVEDTLLPLVSSDHRIDTSRDRLGLLGSSLGGLLSFYACWTRETYGRCACMSSSFWWNGNWTYAYLSERGAPPRDTRFYLDSGDQPAPDGDDEVQTIQVRDALLAKDVEVAYKFFPGDAHNEESWGDRLWAPLTSLW